MVRPSNRISDTYALARPPRATRGWIAAVALSLSAALACGSGPSSPLGTTEQAIWDGVKDDSPIDGVVALKVQKAHGLELCTGALVARNLVLTARHCVSETLATTVACDQEGRSTTGKHVGDDVPGGAIAVFTGNTPSLQGTPSAFGSAVVRPGVDVLCNADMALLVLDRDLDARPLSVRLEGGLQPGERIRAVGYGQNDVDEPTGTRFRKDNVEVLAIGKTISRSKTPLGAREFEVGKSICQGDSGGPAISEATGAVVGVVSRGGSCADNHGHIYTTTTGFRSLFERAFQTAGVALREDVAPVTVSEETSPLHETRAGGCSAAGTRGGAGGTFGLVVLAMASLLGRRRGRVT